MAAASGSRRYVALLRGINLGARNRVSMSRLREIREDVSGEDVKTYIASGNVVLTSADSAAALARRLERSIEKEFAIDIVVVVMTASELATVVRKNPVPDAKPGTLHVAFAAQAIEKSDAARLARLDFPPEEIRVRGRQIYFHLPNGYGRAHLPMEIDRIVGKTTTVRNWKTVVTLSEMASTAAD